MLLINKNKGFSLIELMVAMVVGLFVAAIVATMYVSIIRANSTTVQLSRLSMDMQAALDIIARDIERAGYVSGAEAALARDDDGNVISSAVYNTVSGAMFLASNDLNIDSQHCVLIRYDANNNGVIAGDDPPELLGYRWNQANSTIEYRTWASGTQSCADDPDWNEDNPLAGGDGNLNITGLNFILDPVSGAYTTTGHRIIRIQMSGQSGTNNAIQLELDRRVRLRNDQF